MIFFKVKSCQIRLSLLGSLFGAATLFWPAFVHADELSMKSVVDAFNREGAKRITEGKPPLSTTDLFLRYSDADKRNVLRNMARNNIILDEMPDKWLYIDEASVALPWLRYEKEPFRDPVLASLDRCLRNPASGDERFQINILLYRYGKPSSREMILEKLETEHDLSAATVLALNRESAALKNITPLIEAGKADARLLFALGQWGTQTDKILLHGMEKFQVPAPLDYIWALTMAPHVLGEKESYKVRDFTKSESEVIRIAATGLLLHCHYKVDGGIEYLQQALSNPNSPAAYYAAWCLNHIDGAVPQKRFREMLHDYLDAKNAKAFGSANYEALVGLLKTPSDDDWALALKVLHSLSLPRRLESRYPAIPVAALMYANGPALVREAAAKHVGNAINLQLVENKSLKRIPPKYLPVGSTRVEWNHTDLESGDTNN